MKVSNFFPATGSELEWNAAYFRLEDYLRALHVFNKVHQSQVILQLLQLAAADHQLNPEQSPTTLALKHCHEAMGQWLGKILEERPNPGASELLPLFLADAPERWPASFLAENAPEDFQLAVKEFDQRANPALQVSSMIPRPLDVSPLVGVVLQNNREKISAFTAVATFFVVSSVIALIFFLVT